MLRQLILSAVVATGAVAGVTATPSVADAAPPVGHDYDRDYHRRGVRYEVLVRHHGHWDVYGTYRDREDAWRVVRMLERQGRDARIEVERGRG